MRPSVRPRLEALEDRLAPAGFQTLYSFTGGNDGKNPPFGVIADNSGNLYGTTNLGGANGEGNVFQYSPASKTVIDLHDFSTTGGNSPEGRLFRDSSGNLYGSTYYGGTNGVGTLFRMSSDGSNFTTLHNFANTDGQYPQAAFIMDSEGNLYGTTSFGGTGGNGTVFQLSPDGTGGYSLTTLHNFNGITDGKIPGYSLIMDSQGNLYGATLLGGTSGDGTVYELSPDGSGGYNFTTLHNFTGKDGYGPSCNLLIDGKGNLYGTTYLGGSANDGTVFQLSPNGTGSYNFTTIYTFTGNDGFQPSGNWLMDSSGNLYGATTLGGPLDDGTVYQLSPSGTGSYNLTTLHTFSGKDGFYANGGLVTDNNGNLYGTTFNGGTDNLGTIFELSGIIGITPATTTAASNTTAVFSPNAQNATLAADVTSSAGPVNEGTVTFTILQGSTIIGTATTSGIVKNGVASVSYALPAGLTHGTYSIDAIYNPGPDFLGSSDETHTLTVSPASAVTSAGSASAAYSPNSQSVALNATVADNSIPSDTVDEGSVTFTILNGAAKLGSVVGTVSGGKASANITLPAGLAIGSYTIDVGYSDSQGNFIDSGDKSSTLLVASANVATTANNVSTVYSLGAQGVTLTANLADKSHLSDIVDEGTVAFTVQNGNTIIGSVPGTVNGGKASATFSLPAGLAAGSYTIAVRYSDSSGNFSDSGDQSGTLIVAPANATTTAANDSTVFRMGAQTVTLTADVSSTVGPVDEGEATFTVLEGSTVIGTPTTSGTINNGQASASYVLPAGLAAGSYTIAVSYSDTNGNFSDSGDTNGTLTVTPANAMTTAVNASAFYSPNAQSVTLTANLADTSDSSDIVDEGTVAFTVKNGSTIVGSAVGTVSGGKASAAFSLPAGLTAGDYILDVSYSDSQGNFRDSDDQSATLTVQPANIFTTAVNPPAVVYSTSDQDMTLSANVADSTNPGDIVNEGSVLFTVLNGSEVVRSIAGSVSGGTASADFTLPAGDAAGNYTIAVHYIDSPGNFLDGGGQSATLIVAPDNVSTTASNATAIYNANAQILMLSASIANTSIPSQTVNEGAVTFTVQNGSTIVGSVVGTVSGGSANAALTLPAGLTAGNYSIDVGYSDSQGNFIDGGDNSGTLTIAPINVATTANNVSAGYSTNAQTVTFSANVVNTIAPSQAIDEGVITFTVLNGTKTLGSVTGSVSGGNASATFTLPAGQAVANYTIAVSYSDSSGNFLDSSDQSAELIIAPANVTTTAANNVSAVYSANTQTLALSATVADASIPTDTVNEGAVTFTVQSGSRSLGSVAGTVSGGKANADFTLPAGQAAGSYTIAVGYSDSQGNFSDSRDINATLTVSPANVTVSAAPIASTVYSTDKEVVNLSANIADVSVPSDTVNEGVVAFTIQSGATTIGSVQGLVAGGTANAAITLPAGLAVGSYTIAVHYSDNSGNFSDSGDTDAVLTVTPAKVAATAVNASAAYGPNAQSVTLSANIANTNDSSDIVDEGTVTFTVKNGSTIVGSVSGAVSNGTASAAFNLPAGLSAGDYTIDVSYSDSQGNFTDIDRSSTLTVTPNSVTTTVADASATFRTTAQTVMLSAVVADPANPNAAVGEGTILFAIQKGSTLIGSAVTAVNGGTANTTLTLPAGLAAGNYTIAVGYSDSQGNLDASGDTTGTLTIAAAATTAQLTSATLAPSLMALTTTETLTAHVSSSTLVTQGVVTFVVSGHSVSANVDANGNATATVSLSMLDLLGPQSISVSYGDAANNLTASSNTQTAAWQLLNAVLPSTVTFTASGQSIMADLFGLFITYTNGLLTEIDFGSSHLVFSYNASGKLIQATFDGMALLS